MYLLISVCSDTRAISTSLIWSSSTNMKCFLSQGSVTNANEQEDARWKWWGRDEESEGRRTAPWVSVWLSNKDFRRTSWKHRLHRVISRSERAERPWAQTEGFKAGAKCCAEVKASCLAEEVQWQRRAYLQQSRWLADWLYHQQLEAVSDFWLTCTLASPPTYFLPQYFIHPHRQWCSKANVDVAARLHVHRSHSLSRTSCEWLWWISHLQPWHPLQSVLSCTSTPVHTAQAWVTEYTFICSNSNSGIWKILRSNSIQIIF